MKVCIFCTSHCLGFCVFRPSGSSGSVRNMKGVMRSTRRKLEISSGNSPIPSPSVSQSDCLMGLAKLRSDIKDRIDSVFNNCDAADTERVGNDIMKLLDLTIQDNSMKLLAYKIRQCNDREKEKVAVTVGTTKSNSTYTSASQSMLKGVMKSSAASKRSIAQNKSHIHSRETNQILENVVNVLPYKDSEAVFTPEIILPLASRDRDGGALIPVKPQPELETELAGRTILSLFFSTPGDSMYTRTLSFSDKDFLTKQIKLDYFAFKSSDLNFPMVTFIFFFGVTFFLLRFEFIDNNAHFKDPCYIIALITTMMTAFCMTILVFNRLTLLSFRYNIKCLQKYHKSMISLMKTRYGQLADDGVLIFGVISTALFLLHIALRWSQCGTQDKVTPISGTVYTYFF